MWPGRRDRALDRGEHAGGNGGTRVQPHAVAAGVVLWLALAIAQAVAAPPASNGTHRKIVGLVFDDSGSMKARIQLPAFAAQLLASSLDPVRDRLFTLRMSDFEAVSRDAAVARVLADGGVTPHAMARLRQMRLPDVPRDEFAQGRSPDDVVRRIRERWPNARGDTPYGSIELMIDTLAEAAGPGDEAHLVVLTDGAFDPAPPAAATVERNLSAYRRKARAPITVHFVLIDAAGMVWGNGGKSVREQVADQKVRRILTATFNGEPDVPLHEVMNSQDLMRSILDVVARINATERTARPDGGGIVAVRDRRLTLNSPLSVSRIVGVTFAKDGEPAQDPVASFGAQPTVEVVSRMAGDDSAAGWQGEKLKARAMQYNLQEALAPGSYTITFNQPVGSPHLFLFDTLARVEFEVRDATGAPLHAGADGVAEAVSGQALALVATLHDRVGGADIVVDPRTVPNALVSSWLAGPNGRIGLAASLDAGGNGFVAPFTAGPVGTFEAGGTFSVEGFVRKEAGHPVFRVVDGAVQPALAVRPVDCPACGAGELQTVVHPGEPVAAFGDVDVKLPAGRNAAFSLRLDGTPPWVAIVDSAGAEIAPGMRLAAGADGLFSARLVRRIERPDEPRTHHRHVGVRASMLAPFAGEATSEATLRVVVPEVKLHYRGHTRGQDLDNPLRLSGADLHAGHDSLKFQADGLSDEAVRPADITVTAAGGLVDLNVAADRDWITVRPSSRWCTCLVWLAGAPDEVEVSYRGVDASRAAGPLAFEPSGEELAWSCGAILSALLAAIWAAGAMVVFARTPRFPKHSVAMIKRHNEPADSYEPLRRWDLNGNWRTVLGALRWRQHPARAFVSGVHLEATKGGPRLLLASTNADVRIMSDGRTVRKLREESRSRDYVPVSWTTTFSEQRNFERLSLRKY